jgi:beta-glucosidase
MPWLASVPAVLQQALAGQEAGTALAHAIFGVINPSGKLPISFPASEDTTWLQSPSQYPGLLDENNIYHANYSEGLLVGYRWYDDQDMEPLFPFGFGLSYTTFNYSDLSVTPSILTQTTPISIKAVITNTGDVSGAEVVQLYVGYPEEASEPPKLLKGFTKPFLGPMGSTTVEFSLSFDDLMIWDDDDSGGAGQFVTVSGEYTVYVGSSSRDIRLVSSFLVSSSS